MDEMIARMHRALEPYPWAWTAIALCGLLLLAWIANYITRHVLLEGLKRVLSSTPLAREMPDGQVRLSVIPRLANVVPALVLYIGVAQLPDLPETVVSVVRALCQAFIVLTVALAISRALNLANEAYERRPQARDKPIKGYIQVAKIVMFVLVGISIIATLIGARFLHVITGLGAMTAVMMLIFQDTILSLVASVQISNDGRVRVGDWIEMPAQNADGEVTDIALHTITVQNWDMTVTTLPTKKLISDSFKNWRNMSDKGARRIKRALLLDQSSVRFLSEDDIDRLRRIRLLRDYLANKGEEVSAWNARLADDASEPANRRRFTNIGTFRAYVEGYLRANPDLRQDLTLLVRQLDPGAEGLPLEIYCFSADTRWAVYEQLQSDIFDHLLAILPEFGLRVFQSPTGAEIADAMSLRVGIAREQGDVAARGDDALASKARRA